MKLTEQHFREARSINGAWSRKQIELLGISWPLVHGWKQEIIGCEFPSETIQRFIALKNAHIKPSKLRRIEAVIQKRKSKTPRRVGSSISYKRHLPTVSLDEAINRLGDDKIYSRVVKGILSAREQMDDWGE